MGEADGPAVVQRQKQAVVVEIQPGENELVEHVRRDRLREPGLPLSAPPQLRQEGRVGIAKRPIRQHRGYSSEIHPPGVGRVGGRQEAEGGTP